MRYRLAAMVLVLAGCDKGSKPVTDTPSATSSSTPAPTTSSAMANPAPPGSKQGPMPDDPLLANQSPEPMPPQAAALARASNKLAFDLWARTNKTPGNAAFSPASISIAMAMTGLGAKGDTSRQIAKAMHFEGGEETTAESWGKVARAMSAPTRSLKLRIANRLFGERTYQFEQPYVDKTRTYFGAPLEPVDFRNAFEPSRAKINDWVSEQTEKRIVDLLPVGSISALTRLVLVNAVYFLADWAEPFEKTATRYQPFELTASTKKSVPMMRNTSNYGIGQMDGVKVLELPYKGGDASMLVVLPEKKGGLPEIEKAINVAKLQAWRKGLSTKLVDVTLPRFEVSPPTMPLANDLAELGMPLAFDRDKADFTGIGKPEDPRERLHIGTVLHKAFVKVDEKGTEAAAATAVAMAASGAAPPKPIEFRADHPFLFFIVDRPTGLVLFMGRMADPAAK